MWHRRKPAKENAAGGSRASGLRRLGEILSDYFVATEVSLPELGNGKLAAASSVVRAILGTMIPPIAAPPNC